MKNQIETKEQDSTKLKNPKTEHNTGRDNQKTSFPDWQETFDAALDIIALISADFEILKINKAGYENIGKNPDELIGKKCYQVVHGLNSPIDGCPCQNVLKTGRGGTGEIRDHGRIYLATASPILDRNSDIIALAHTIKDITEQKRTERVLQNTQMDLERKVRERTADLDRKNIALQEIIAQIEIDKKRMKEDIRINIENIIFPVLETMKKEKGKNKYIHLLIHCLKDLTSSYGITLTNGNIKLSPREIEICNLVKAAYTNKEIAKLLDISNQTVEWHRKRIRFKLGIANKKINLSTYLHSL